ncbi:MAG: hypothetical protein C0433_16295 [Cyclobacterium sp.]|nr:hypothetical protein [Cyclobacterium sp.]
MVEMKVKCSEAIQVAMICFSGDPNPLELRPECCDLIEEQGTVTAYFIAFPQTLKTNSLVIIKSVIPRLFFVIYK